MSRILVVDGDPMLRECLIAGLQHHGHRTYDASSSRDAVPLVEYADAVICDGLNGFFCGVSDECEKNHIPFLLYSGDADLVDDAKEMGISALLKPAPIKQILSTLGQAVGAVTR